MDLSSRNGVSNALNVRPHLFVAACLLGELNPSLWNDRLVLRVVLHGGDERRLERLDVGRPLGLGLGAGAVAAHAHAGPEQQHQHHREADGDHNAEWQERVDRRSLRTRL